MSTVDTVIKNEETTQAGMRFFSAAELREITPSIPWLVRGILRQESLCTLIGAPGAGKSFVALDLACCVAAGRSWHGHRVEQGPVFYIAGEGVEGLKLRLKVWEQQYGKTGEFFLSETPVALIDTKSVEKVVLGIANLALVHGLPRLIVIDTLARNMGRGDENSNSDMSVVINNIDTLLRNIFNAAVLIVHHSGYGEKRRGRASAT